MSGLTTVGFFLTSLLFAFVILGIWIRIALRYLRISMLNPFGQLIHSLTNPLIQPFLSLTQLRYRPGQRYDWPAFIALIGVELLKNNLSNPHFISYSSSLGLDDALFSG